MGLSNLDTAKDKKIILFPSANSNLVQIGIAACSQVSTCLMLFGSILLKIGTDLVVCEELLRILKRSRQKMGLKFLRRIEFRLNISMSLAL